MATMATSTQAAVLQVAALRENIRAFWQNLESAERALLKTERNILEEAQTMPRNAIVAAKDTKQSATIPCKYFARGYCRTQERRYMHYTPTARPTKMAQAANETVGGTPNTPSRHSMAGMAAGDNLKHAVDDGKMMSLLQQYRQAQVACTCVWLYLARSKARWVSGVSRGWRSVLKRPRRPVRRRSGCGWRTRAADCRSRLPWQRRTAPAPTRPTTSM